MSITNQALSTSVKKLLTQVGIKTLSYNELKLKVNSATEIIPEKDFLFSQMEKQKALHWKEMNVIAVDDNALVSTEDVTELVLHELIHMTKNKCERVYEGEKGMETEECVAQIGMFKLVLVLGLNPAVYADKTFEYLKGFQKANYRRAEVDSDRAVEYLVRFVGLERVA